MHRDARVGRREGNDMKKAAYKERDYAFGQLMLRLRITINLTQAGLAEQLGVSRHAVGEWEAGLSYPKAERLKHLILLGVRASTFAAGHEEEEIRTLWKAARQKIQLDEVWLHDLLAPPEPIQHFLPAKTYAPHSGEDSAASPRIDWIGALDVNHFVGREVEVAELTQWIVQEHCRVVMLLGMGGIGKSLLTSFLGQRLAPQFDAVLWRSVRDAPVCEDVVADCITFFSETPPTTFPPSLELRINQLLTRLQTRRCLLVLDNLETLLEIGDHAGNYLPGYEGYGRLVQRLAESVHQSCVLLTSREKPKEIQPLEGARGRVRSFRLAGVDEQTAQALLLGKGLRGTPVAWQHLVASYAGNPLTLKIVAQMIADLFDDDIDRFLHEGSVIFNGIRSMLRQQVERLTSLEHLLLTWLAVLREWTPLETLQQLLHPRVPRTQMLEALEALRRRSLLEPGQQMSFSLQSVVMEYLTNVLVERLSKEIVQGKPQQIRRYALEQGQAKDYIRQTQVRLLIYPLLDQLRSELGADALVEAQLLHLLEQFRSEDGSAQGYGPTNVISLLKALRGHLRDLDLSHLTLRSVSLQGIEMKDTKLSGAILRDCVFTETIDSITTVAVSKNSQYWATANIRGEVRVWGEAGRTLHRVWQAHSATGSSLAFSPNGHTLASGGWDNTVKLWDVASGSLLWSGWQTGSINAVAFAPDGSLLASGGGNTLVQVWEPQSGTNVQTLAGQGGTVCSLAWSPDGKLLASGCADGSIWIWALKLREPDTSVQVFAGHTHWVTGLAFSPDRTQLASVSFRLWNTITGVCLQTLHDPESATYFQSVAWSPDGSLLACGSYLRGVQMWDMTTYTHLWVVVTQSPFNRSVAWSPDGTRIVSGDDNGSVYVWDARDGTLKQQLMGHQGAVMSVAWSPDGRWLASASGSQKGGELFVWAAYSGQRVQAFTGHPGLVYDLAWSPSGDILFSGGSDGMLRWWKVAGGVCIRVQEAHRGTVYALKVSPDGGRLATCGEDGAIRLWDLHSSELLRTLRRDRPYERLNITGIQGLSEARKASLHALGAFEDMSVSE
jgi:WD40 repeat protein/transcriptional regulator with XRE-family HTH domain